MTDKKLTDEQIAQALKCCSIKRGGCKECPLWHRDGSCTTDLVGQALKLINRQKSEIDKLNKFKSYFDDLYGDGLEIANWHMNGDLESFDNFYDAAIEYMG